MNCVSEGDSAERHTAKKFIASAFATSYSEDIHCVAKEVARNCAKYSVKVIKWIEFAIQRATYDLTGYPNVLP